MLTTIVISLPILFLYAPSHASTTLTKSTSPNRGSMLDLLVSIKNNLKQVKDGVDSVKKDVVKMKAKQEKMETGVAFLNEGIYTSYSAMFVGKGNEGSHADEVYFDNVETLPDCFRICFAKRSTDQLWNGVVFYLDAGQCWCEKNDIGHSEQSSLVHYRFV